MAADKTGIMKAALYDAFHDDLVKLGIGLQIAGSIAQAAGRRLLKRVSR